MSTTINAPLERYLDYTSTCNGKNIDNFFNGFFAQFQDSFCYTFVIQFLIVGLMYSNVGKGKYWKILFYAALAGLLGAILENATVAFICVNGKEEVRYRFVIPFLIDELFWIPCEFAIPYLNLIKMKVFSKGRLSHWIKYGIYGLTVPFVVFRFCIGYFRMINGYLQDEQIHAFHGYAFAVMAVADIVCTFAILYFVRVNNTKVSMKSANITHYIKHSSYTILLAVDFVSVFLSICNIISNVGPWKESFPNKLVTPLHCLKCSFILILSADALIFKYGANTSSVCNSDNYSRTNGTYGINSESRTYGTYGTYGNFNDEQSQSVMSQAAPSISNFKPSSSTYRARLASEISVKNGNQSNLPNICSSSEEIYKIENGRGSSDAIYNNNPGKPPIYKNYGNTAIPVNANSNYDPENKVYDMKYYPSQGYINQINDY